VFDDWIPEGEPETVANDRVEREVVDQGSSGVAEVEQGTRQASESRSKEKGKEVSGSKSKKKRGRPPKQQKKK
jgi:hypothetical protein